MIRGAPLLLLPALLMLGAAHKDPLAGRVPGPAAECIDDQFSSSGPNVVDQHTILYRQSGKRIWVTHPVGDCPSLEPVVTLVVEKYGSRLCHNDRFRVIQPGSVIPGPICRFGPFTPYDKPGKR